MTGGAPSIRVVLAEDAVEELASFTAEHGGASALVVMDANTREAAGTAVVAALRAAGVAVEEFAFEERTGLRPGPEQAAAVRRRIDAAGSPSLLVSVGSGVITDITRHAAHGADRDFVSVPTAASMDGYASSVAAMQVDGVKVTYPSRAPLAIFADPRVAAAAPAELTRAGIGDLLAKATARIDWLAASSLYGEPFDDEAAALVLGPLRFAAAEVASVVAGEPDAISTLLEGLIESGIAMAIVGSSRPASGAEHHASHFWDLLAARGLRSHHSHGLQVGYATHFAMRLQRFAFGDAAPVPHLPAPVGDPLGPEAREWLGEPSPEIVAAVAEKGQFTAQVARSWPRHERAWEELRDRLASSLGLFAFVERALDHAGIPSAPGYLEVDERTLRATFQYATRLRARYTVVDFLEGQGLLEAAIDAMLA